MARDPSAPTLSMSFMFHGSPAILEEAVFEKLWLFILLFGGDVNQWLGEVMALYPFVQGSVNQW